MQNTSIKTIERLILYRRSLLTLSNQKINQIFSHQLAKMAGVSSAQVRRDIMSIGYSGSPAHGYDYVALLESLSDMIDAPVKQGVVLVGLGHVGRAILHYFQGRRPKLEITAIFDNDPAKTNRVLHGCHAYAVEKLQKIVKKEKLAAGIIAVPVSAAQEVADEMVRGGIKAILNYAPIKLDLPTGIYIENRDVTGAIEKIAYFARKSTE